MTTPSPRPPLSTIPPPQQEPVRVEGMTDARGMGGPCCRCSAELLVLVNTEPYAWWLDLLLVAGLLSLFALYVVLDRGLELPARSKSPGWTPASASPSTP